jgi:hypothetical protein
MSPLVSIVIPCFNAAHLVGEAIESALCQDGPDSEVIVIDDGSTDESLSVIRSYGERVRWESGPNRGACAARNRGLAMAKGEWIQFLDADDLLLPGKLAIQFPHALASAPDRLSICFGSPSDGNKFFDWQYSRKVDSERDPVDYVLGGAVPTCAPLHSRQNLLAVGGFDEALPCAQETDLHLRLVCSGIGIAQLPEKLYVVRRQTASLSADSTRVLLQQRKILARALGILGAAGPIPEVRKTAFATLMVRTAAQLRKMGCGSEAEELLEDARRLVEAPELMAWTPRWRPLARILGSQRTEALRNGLVRIRGRWSR